jgi:hypothetical protein
MMMLIESGDDKAKINDGDDGNYRCCRDEDDSNHDYVIDGIECKDDDDDVDDVHYENDGDNGDDEDLGKGYA